MFRVTIRQDSRIGRIEDAPTRAWAREGPSRNSSGQTNWMYFTFTLQGEGQGRPESNLPCPLLRKEGDQVTKAWSRFMLSEIYCGVSLHGIFQSCEMSMPQNMRPQPVIALRVRTSSRMIHPPMAAKTASRLRIMAACAGRAFF